MRRYKKENLFYKGLQKSNSLLYKVLKNPRLFLTIAISGIVFLLLATLYRRALFTFLLIGAGALSLIYQKYFRYSGYIGVELCMMATVLTGLKYGPHYGAFTGFTVLFIAYILNGTFKHSSFISLLTLPLIGVIVSLPLFREFSLLFIGMLMTVIYDAVILPLYVLLGSRILPSVIFFITHIMFNYWVFSTLAPLILKII